MEYFVTIGLCTVGVKLRPQPAWCKRNLVLSTELIRKLTTVESFIAGLSTLDLRKSEWKNCELCVCVCG